MNSTPVQGPYKRLQLGNISVPLYMMPFDKRGAGKGEQTRHGLIEDLRAGRFTHVFVCSHGWNNTFEGALSRYEDFITGYHALQEAHTLPRPEPYRPVVLGVYWPSIALTLPGEKPPRIAGMPGQPVADGNALAVTELTSEMTGSAASRVAELASEDSLSQPDAAELAALLAASDPVEGDELDAGAIPVSADILMDIWADVEQAGLGSAQERRVGPESFRAPPADQPAAEADARRGPQPSGPTWPAPPQAAGLPHVKFDPRDIVRVLTVRTMKDRAGVVGFAGVGPLLRDLLQAAPSGHVHLTGHSYGCRVLLAALCAPGMPRPVDSLLLLQPAVNYQCFAGQVPKIGKPGGFRPALWQVRQPILSTFSARDIALHDFFQLAVRRRSDLGEARIAGLGQVPSLYCALGGWGPGGLTDNEAKEVALTAYPARYNLATGPVRVCGVRADAGIHGHSDIVNDFTFWALYNQVTA